MHMSMTQVQHLFFVRSLIHVHEAERNDLNKGVNQLLLWMFGPYLPLCWIIQLHIVLDRKGEFGSWCRLHRYHQSCSLASMVYLNLVQQQLGELEDNVQLLPEIKSSIQSKSNFYHNTILVYSLIIDQNQILPPLHYYFHLTLSEYQR